jgi:uncharacterized protein YecT (DUF1311 family)
MSISAMFSSCRFVSGYMRSLSSAVLLSLVSIAHPAFAQSVSGYRDFAPTQTQIVAAVSPSFIECMELAGANKSSGLNCANVEQSHADRRLDEAYRAYLGRLPAADARILRREQQAWLRTRKNMCLSRVERMNTSDAWGELIKCGLQETIRRQIYIQTRA